VVTAARASATDHGLLGILVIRMVIGRSLLAERSGETGEPAGMVLAGLVSETVKKLSC
jgi:hypothetical protein